MSAREMKTYTDLTPEERIQVLDWIDPDWREHFGQYDDGILSFDAMRAIDFYKPEPSTIMEAL